MLSVISIDIILSSVMTLGSYLAVRYGHKTKRFRWREYIALLIAPFICTLVLANLYGPKIWQFVVLSAIVGTTAEYVWGYLYHQTLNHRLWTYNRFSLHGYTSLLSIPFWAMGGLVFWFLGKTIGL